MKFVLAFDTACTSWGCVRDENDKPFLYNSIEETEEDVFAENDFIIPINDFKQAEKLFSQGAKGIGIAKRSNYGKL